MRMRIAILFSLLLGLAACETYDPSTSESPEVQSWLEAQPQAVIVCDGVSSAFYGRILLPSQEAYDFMHDHAPLYVVSTQPAGTTVRCQIYPKVPISPQGE